MSSDPQPSRLRLTREQRLRRPADFQRVYDGRFSVADDRLLIYALKNDCGATRVGVSVSRRWGGAVARNRWKRVLREAFRLNQWELPAGLDYVLIPRRSPPPTVADIGESLVKLSRRVARRIESGRNKPPRQRRK
ncbi:MAG: ribonuclease P protein component [Pirellulales bacterium]